MLQQTYQQLTNLRLSGMKEALKQQMEFPNNFDLAFEERISLIVSNEIVTRNSNRIKKLVKDAKFKVNAQPQDIIYDHGDRRIDKSKIAQILSCQWLEKNQNVIIDGPTGIGKTFLACAIGYQVCKNDHSVLYLKTANLINDLKVAKLDGSYRKLFAKLIKPKVIIFDEWGVAQIDGNVDKEILDLFDERYYSKSNIFAGQKPINCWKDIFTDPTIAEAVMDRVINNSYNLNLKGESLRKK